MKKMQEPRFSPADPRLLEGLWKARCFLTSLRSAERWRGGLFIIANFLEQGNNFLDLTSTLSSLSGQDLLISSGSGNDILWLSDADEIVNSGDGNDRIILNGGTDTLSTGSGNDVIYLSNNTGNLIISDFDTSTDQFIFSCSSQNISAIGNQIIASNSIGNYTVTLSNYPDLSDLDSFSTYLITW